MINSRSMRRTHSVIVEILIYKNLILNSRDSAVKKGNELEGDIDIEGDFFRPGLSIGKNKNLFCHFMSIMPRAEFSPPLPQACSFAYAHLAPLADSLAA